MIEERLQAEMDSIATNEDVMILSFVAPDVPTRLSGGRYMTTSITMADLYKIEDVFNGIKDHPQKLHLIVHTPWWEVYATTKIAKYLRDKFEYITAFVPYESASWWTVLCLWANDIVMDSVWNLTPIDHQTWYKWQRIAVWSYTSAILNLTKWLDKESPDQVTSPFKELCEKLDPVIREEMQKKEKESLYLAIELLSTHMDRKKEREKVLNIAKRLSMPNTIHSHVIDYKEASEIWLPIVDLNENKNMLQYLKIYKEFVKLKKSEQSQDHLIECFLPSYWEEDDRWEETTAEQQTEWE